MNSNKAVDQQQHETVIHQYFNSFSKYDGVDKSSQKALSLIEEGRLTIHPQTPFPIRPKDITVFKPPRKHLIPARLRIIKSLSQKPTPKHQMSNKNRRYLQSLLQKYRVFETAIQKMGNSEDSQNIGTQIFQKISHYEQLLRNSPQRLPNTEQEKQFIEQQTYNIRLANAMGEDQARLKVQARRLNCSLHRKDKYYDCLDDIRKKINSLEKGPQNMQQIISHGKSTLTQASEPPRKTAIERRLKPLVRPERQKGRAYLNYSRQVGVQSKEIYERERGKVRFLKEVIHHWWSDSDSQRVPTVQSSLA